MTIWKVCLILSIICFIAGYIGVFQCAAGKKHRTGDAIYAAFAGVIAAGVIIFIPVYKETFAGDAWAPFKCFIISVHSAIRLFMVDGEFTIIRDSIEDAGITAGTLYKLYTSFAAILFVNAPILTFSFIFSFLRKISDRVHYMFGVRKNCYVFSDLNERSVTLAEDLYQKGNQIVFTDVFQKNSEESNELSDRAERIGAVCFRKDILDIDFASLRGKEKDLFFFIMGDQRSENLTQALKLIDKYKNRENTRLFYFSDDENSDLQFASANKGKVKVKRVNMARVLIDRMLFEKGYKLFEAASEEEDGLRRIHAVIVGLGRHGTNMLKEMSWFCQMDGFDLEIDAFDKDLLAQEKLELQCPDLLSGKYNGKKDPDEAMYTIAIHPGIDVETRRFADAIEKLPETNYVIVALGDDEKNLRTAVMLRSLFARMNKSPRIQAIVYNSDEKEALQDARHFSGKEYNIDFFGDMRSTYCRNVIINSELEEEALYHHKHYYYDGKEEKDVDPAIVEEATRTFWMYEYNYRSSVASAIHSKARKELEARDLHHEIENEEHRRWNAYMRSEGYILKGEIGQKDHLARIHGDLVSNSLLRKHHEEYQKDRNIKKA